MLKTFFQESWQWGVTLLIFVFAGTSGVIAQPELNQIPLAKSPQRTQTYTVDSGIHSAEAWQREGELVYEHTVQIEDAPWLRIHFDDYDLGNNSYLILTSSKDNSQQRFVNSSLAEWNGATAYFNGGEVRIALYVAPGDEGIFFEVGKIQVGEQPMNDNGAGGDDGPFCNEKVDDRVSSNDPALGRFIVSSNPDVTVNCTGWLVSNGALLAAGHCNAFNDIVQFNVPASDEDGSYNHPPPEDQYPVHRVAFSPEIPEGGEDWSIYGVGRNSSTNLLPVEAYGGFYRMLQGGTPDSFRVSGYGRDWIPSGSTGGENSDSRTQQTHSGEVIGEFETQNRVVWRSYAHVEPGNSGSPMIIEGTSVASAIATHCGSERVTGTSFSTPQLADSMQAFLGQSVIHVDNGYDFPNPTRNGNVFRPFHTVSEGVNATATGGVLSIVAGTYPETLTINKAMRIEAPVGTVRIDPNAPPSLVAKTGTPQANAMGEERTRDVPEEFRLVQNYPNPVSSETQIEFGLPEATRVSLVVYDVLGREVVRLVDGAMEAGVHEVDVDTSNLPAGVYVYRIRAGDFVQSRRMLVVK